MLQCFRRVNGGLRAGVGQMGRPYVDFPLENPLPANCGLALSGCAENP